MLTINQIMDAAEETLLALWPELPVHRSLVNKDFTRPAALLEAEGLTMQPCTIREVERGVDLKITLFEAVDDYHHTHVEALAEKLSIAMEQFSAAAFYVADRYLDVGKVQGEYEYDYAQLTVPLSWMDDRDTGPQREVMEHYTLAVEAGRREKEESHG